MNKFGIKTICAMLCCVLCAALFCGCSVLLQWDEEIPYQSPRATVPARTAPPEQDADGTGEPAASPTSAPASTPAPEPTAETAAPTEEPTEAPTEAPKSSTASLGFGGDLLLMQTQIQAARTGSGYDFKDMFRPMQGLFESVDFMMLNFEGTLAGAAAGYTEPKPTAIPPTEENPNPPKLYQRFNAPDEIVTDLMALGVDGFSTANNHCLDKGIDGLLRTIQVMDAAGAFHTGTFASASAFNTADIVEINGIKVGFVSTTHYINSYDSLLSSEQAGYMITRLYNDAMTQGALRRCREQGAEIVIALPHWGSQYKTELHYDQEQYTQKLISWGADAIIGCHPHVIQTVQWVTGSRSGATVRVPVAYSMGNFISNMSRDNYPVDIGMFVRVDIEKTSYGARVTDISCVATYDWLHSVGGRYINEVLPCFGSMSGVPSLAGLGDAQSGIERAKQHLNELVPPSIPICKNPYIG